MYLAQRKNSCMIALILEVSMGRNNLSPQEKGLDKV